LLTTTQRHLRKRERSRSCSLEGDWVLNVTRMSVARGHCAGTAAFCGRGIGTLTAARHAVILRLAIRVVFVVVFCVFYITSLLDEYHELQGGIRWKISRMENVSL